ncbi:MAG: hypothetical protein GY701_34390, partial [Sulfitobacter sp.]|nr:hypothetical protein [Sulfitobacter sp.]
MNRRREEDRHLSMVQSVVAEVGRVTSPETPRGFERQRVRRELEARVRQRSMRLQRRLYRRGCNHADVARSVDLRRTTLAEWRQRFQLGKLSARPLGRPVQRLSTETLRRIHDQLVVHGPGTGLSTLQVLFPDVPRRELKVQRDRFRKKWLDEHKQLVESLRWTRPGAVWAMDFTEPDRPIEGPFKHVLL